MAKKVCISQSNYIPWKGYFKNISEVDVFIVYDDMQYTRRDWRNRNLIKTPTGLKWITIPVEVKGRYYQKINETVVSGMAWRQDHLKTLKQFYSKAKHYKSFKDIIEHWYNNIPSNNLSEINIYFISLICKYFGITTEIISSDKFKLEGDITGKIVNLCTQVEATDYFSGPAARAYLDETQFISKEIKVHYFDYDGYPVYDQLFPPFHHGVTVLDMIFNLGSGGKSFFEAEVL